MVCLCRHIYGIYLDLLSLWQTPSQHMLLLMTALSSHIRTQDTSGCQCQNVQHQKHIFQGKKKNICLVVNHPSVYVCMLLAASNPCYFHYLIRPICSRSYAAPFQTPSVRLNEISTSSTLTSWNCLRGKQASHFNRCFFFPVSPSLYDRSVCQWTVFVLFFSLHTLLESFYNRRSFNIGH